VIIGSTGGDDRSRIVALGDQEEGMITTAPEQEA
jgi:hypothetical protein